MVVIETDDPIHREWLRERLRDLRHLHGEYSWENTVMEEVLAFQSAHMGQQADLADIMRRWYMNTAA